MGLIPALGAAVATRFHPNKKIRPLSAWSVSSWWPGSRSTAQWRTPTAPLSPPERFAMKSTSRAFALLGTAVLSALVLIGAAPVSPPTKPMTGSASHPLLWTNPTPHVYLLGERVSTAYGPLAEVPDWQTYNLLSPAEGHRWVHYGDTYLLIESHSALIRTITMASLPEGRA